MWNGLEQTCVGMQSVILSFPVHAHLLMISICGGVEWNYELHYCSKFLLKYL